MQNPDKQTHPERTILQSKLSAILMGITNVGPSPDLADLSREIKDSFTLIRFDGGELAQAANDTDRLEGLDAKFIRTIAQGYKSIAPVTLEGIRDNREGVSARSKWIKATLSDGIIRVINPFTGRVCSAIATLGREWLIIDHADDYCLISQMGGTMISVDLESVWVFPNRSLIIAVDNGLPDWAVYDELIALCRRILSNGDAVSAYMLNARSPTPRSLAVSDFSCPHMSHNLWNLQTGWANVLTASGTSNICQIICYSNQNFFGSLKKLYDDILPTDFPYVEVADDDQLFDFVLKNDLTVLVVKDEMFTDDFARRVLLHAKSVCSPEFLREVGSFVAGRHPIVLTTIRLDNRSWIEQEDGIVNLFKAMKGVYPSIAVVLDGLSSDSARGWTTGWMSMEAELELARKVRERLAPDIPVILAVGRTFAESLVLMDASDCFIAPSGSGMAIYKWVCNMPGLAFSNRAVLNEDNPYSSLRVWHDDRYRAGLVETVHLPSRLVRDGEIRRGEASRADFHLDWRDLFGEAIDFLNGCSTFNRVRWAGDFNRELHFLGAQLEHATEVDAAFNPDHDWFSSYMETGFDLIEGWPGNKRSVLFMRNFRDIFAELNENGGVCEIGVHHAKYLIALHNIVGENRSLGLDLFEDQARNVDQSGQGDQEVCLTNISRYAKNSHLIELRQQDTMALTQSDLVQIRQDFGPFAFVSVDGGHTKVHVSIDLHIAAQLVSGSGIIVLNDVFHPDWPEVTEGIYSVLGTKRISFVPFLLTRKKLFFCSISLQGRYLDFVLSRRDNDSAVKIVDFCGYRVASINFGAEY